MGEDDAFAISAEEQERRDQVAIEATRLRNINALKVWAKMLEALAIKLEVPDQYRSYDHIIADLRRVMERVTRCLGGYT